MIAACLLTHGRHFQTEATFTASTFARLHKDRRGKDIAFLHCDTEPAPNENCRIAGAYGFSSVSYSGARADQMDALRAFIDSAIFLKAYWLLLLDFGWSFCQPLPSPGFFTLAEEMNVQTIRLFGIRKMKDDIPSAYPSEYRFGTKDKIEWTETETFPDWQVGFAHWVGGGSLIRADLLTTLQHLPNLSEIALRQNELLSLRPKKNLLWRVGMEDTQGFSP